MNEVDSGCIHTGKNELLPYNFLCINWLTLYEIKVVGFVCWMEQILDVFFVWTRENEFVWPNANCPVEADVKPSLSHLDIESLQW